MSINQFKSRYSSSNTKKKEYIMLPTDYPELTPSKLTYNNTTDSDSNFANAILKPIDNTEDNNILAPGWISIKFENNQFIYKYGPKTYKQQLEDKRLENEKIPNNIIKNISSKIHNNRERYINEYNEINGPYAYEEFYQSYLFNEYSDEEVEEEEDDNEEEFNE
jgi:hypothetical protein